MQAKRFVSSWEAGMEAVAQKSEELQQMSAVGADIDIVKCQLEEHKVRTMQQLLQSFQCCNSNLLTVYASISIMIGIHRECW